ncbi:MAG: FkbM family methyltransferase [Bacteroidia bacterium]
MLRTRFPEHYFIANFIKDGDVSIDLGANLGYYTVPLSRMVGESGKVYSVEPVSMFVSVLRRNLKFTPYNNVEIIQNALGEEEGAEVTMGITVEQGVLRHGLTKVLENPPGDSNYRTYLVTVRKPQNIFGNLPRLDFIKCDVEGYEIHIMPEFHDILQKYKPLVQIEIGPLENRKKLFALFSKLGYKAFNLVGNKLEYIATAEAPVNGDYYFIHNEAIKNHSNIITFF